MYACNICSLYWKQTSSLFETRGNNVESWIFCWKTLGLVCLLNDFFFESELKFSIEQNSNISYHMFHNNTCWIGSRNSVFSGIPNQLKNLMAKFTRNFNPGFRYRYPNSDIRISNRSSHIHITYNWLTDAIFTTYTRWTSSYWNTVQIYREITHCYCGTSLSDRVNVTSGQKCHDKGERRAP